MMIEFSQYYVLLGLQKDQKYLEELHNEKVFTGIPRISFINGKSLKDHLARLVLTKIASNSGPCGSIFL